MAAEREKTFNDVKDEYEQHRMVQRDREAKYRAANREILREKAKTHYANNREEILRKKPSTVRTIVRKSTNKTERDTLGTERKSFGGRLRNACLRNRKNLRSSGRVQQASQGRKKILLRGLRHRLCKTKRVEKTFRNEETRSKFAGRAAPNEVRDRRGGNSKLFFGLEFF